MNHKEKLEYDYRDRQNKREIRIFKIDYLLGTCSEVPLDSRMRTNTVFPVKKGTEVVVDCVEGYTLTSGERTLTCVQDAEYTVWRNFPSCTIG